MRVEVLTISVQISALEYIFKGRLCISTNIAHLSPEFGKMSHARITQYGNDSMSRTES